jgi:peptide/nickel transport system substrate-binding protein
MKKHFYKIKKTGRGVAKLTIVVILIAIVVVVFIAAYYLAIRHAPYQPMIIVIGDTRTMDTSFDPAVGWSSLDAFVQRHCYDTLVEYSEPDLKIKPALATNWTISDDATEYTFTLRKDVKFQDGTPLNATAVKFSIDRSLRMQQLQYYYTSVVKEVEVLDTYKVRIKLNYPFAPFLDALTWTAFSIVNPNVVAKKGDSWLFDHTAGSGRFNLTEYVKGEKLVLEANKNHWDPPKVDKIIYKIYADTTALRSALEAGEVDIIIGEIPPDDVVAFENNPNFNVYEGGGVIMVLWSFCMKPEIHPYSAALKKAIVSAIDLESALKLVYKGTVTPLYSIIPTYFWTYTPIFKIYYPYNITKAKEFLAEAGFPEGATVDVYVESQYTHRLFLFQVFKEQLAAAGITLNIHPIETSAWLDLLYKGEAISSATWWGPVYNDPNEPLGMLESEASIWAGGVFYNNSYVDQLFIEHRSTLNKTRREEISLELQKINAEDIAYFPLFQYSDKIIAAKYVKGLSNLHVRYPIWWHKPYKETSTSQSALLHLVILNAPVAKVILKRKNFRRLPQSFIIDQKACEKWLSQGKLQD